MTIKGYNGEITAYFVRNGGTIKVYVGYVNWDDEHPWASYADIASSGSISWTTDGSDNIHKMLDETVYFPISMMVDNFDNDGYKNDIVVVFTNRVTVLRYAVLQVLTQAIIHTITT